ncbi:MAG: VCBS repeat-containing protein [Gemmataceae bacterium]|nr:VCBS repeat-containing protein [Gemmataceae bacterium]
MKKRLLVCAGLAALSLVASAPPNNDKKTETTGELLSPVRVEAAGKPVDTEVGHAHPLYADFDGDGKRDLLVGQFGSGILWIYLNVGNDAKPQFAAGTQFKGGRVPTG